MPKSIKQSLDVQNTIASPNLSTVARPVDTYVQPEQPRELQTAEALKSLGQGLSGLAQNYRQSKEAEDLAGLDGEIAAAEASVKAGDIEHIKNHGGFAQYSPAVLLQLNNRLGKKAGSEAASKLQDYFTENPAALRDDALRDQAILEMTPELSDGASKVYNGALYSQYAAAAEALTNTGRQLRNEEVIGELKAGLMDDLTVSIGTEEFDPEVWINSDAAKHSTLIPSQLKNLYVDAVIAKAKTTLDVSYLDDIPDRMTNNLTQAEIAQAKKDVGDAASNKRYRVGLHNEQVTRAENLETIRDINIKMNDDPLNFNATDYSDAHPDVYAHALRMEKTELIRVPQSKKAAEAARLHAQKRLGSGDDLDDIRNEILAREDMRQSDKDAVITRIERLEDVPNELATNKNYGSAIASIKAAGKSAFSFGDESRLLLDREVQAQLDQFEDDLYSQFVDYMEENNGKQPSRRVQKDWIRDLRKEAVEEIEQYIVPNIEPVAADSSDPQEALDSILKSMFFSG